MVQWEDSISIGAVLLQQVSLLTVTLPYDTPSLLV